MIVPFTSDVNFTPSSVEPGSAASGVEGEIVEGQMVHAAQLTAAGVTAFDAAEAGPVPTAFYGGDLERVRRAVGEPPDRGVVAGGLPVTVVGVCAVAPMYGVTV